MENLDMPPFWQSSRVPQTCWRTNIQTDKITISNTALYN